VGFFVKTEQQQQQKLSPDSHYVFSCVLYVYSRTVDEHTPRQLLCMQSICIRKCELLLKTVTVLLFI